MENLPSTRQLQYLVALAETRSFSRAALRCHVTQSTLSAGIAALETLLGHKLVERGQRHITLTPLGADIVDKAQHILTDARAIVARARHNDAPLAGPLRMGIIPTIAPYFLPRILPHLREALPDTDLQLHEDLSDRLIDALKNGTVECILMAFPYPMNGIVEHDLFSEPFFLACRKGAWQGKTPLGTKDLEGQDLLLLEEGHCLRAHALQACNLSTARERRLFSATSLPTLIQMVQHGYGMTLLPAMAAQAPLLPDTIDVIPFKNPAPHRRIGLAWRKDSPRQDEYKMLAQILLAAGTVQADQDVA